MSSIFPRTLSDRVFPVGNDTQHHQQRQEISMRLFMLITLLVVFMCSSGCSAPVALGIIGAAGSDGPVVFNHLSGGKSESYCIAKYDDVVAAVLNAGDALSLEVKEKKVDKNLAVIRYCDAKNESIDLSVERRSDTMTSIKLDVGWFGSVAFSRLMARQIISELNKSKSFLDE